MGSRSNRKVSPTFLHPCHVVFNARGWICKHLSLTGSLTRDFKHLAVDMFIFEEDDQEVPESRVPLWKEEESGLPQNSLLARAGAEHIEHAIQDDENDI